MFSSYRDQNSYADAEFSRFTRALFQAISGRELGTVRYKDLVSSIADAFEGDAQQKPFFVAQADQTEVFFTLSEEIKATVARALSPTTMSKEPSGTALSDASPIMAALRVDAARYVTAEVASERLEQLKAALEAQHVPTPLRAAYTIEGLARSAYSGST